MARKEEEWEKEDSNSRWRQVEKEEEKEEEKNEEHKKGKEDK